MNGQKERLMVLDMLSEGKITPEEAEQLFNVMEEVPDENTASDSPKLVPGLSHLSHLAALSPASPVSPVSPVSPMNARNVRVEELVSALKDADIDHVTISDLQEIQTHRLTAEYIREILALGLEPDGLGEWI